MYDAQSENLNFLKQLKYYTHKHSEQICQNSDKNYSFA